MWQLTTGPKSKQDFCEKASNFPSVYLWPFIKAWCKSKVNYNPFVKSSGSHMKSKPNISVFSLLSCEGWVWTLAVWTVRQTFTGEILGNSGHTTCAPSNKRTAREVENKRWLRQNSMPLSRTELVWNWGDGRGSACHGTELMWKISALPDIHQGHGENSSNSCSGNSLLK